MTTEASHATAPHVYRAICAVMAAMAKEGVAKTRNNAQQGYKFRGIDDVYAALSHHLAANMLCMLPRVVSREYVERVSKSGGVLNYAILDVEFDLVSAIDGSKHTIRTVGEAMDSADKSSNKSMSAATKYACLIAFQIPTEGDNDADATTPQPATRKAPELAAPLSTADVNPIVERYVSAIDRAAEVKDLLTVYASVTQDARLPVAAKEYVTQLLSTMRRKLEGRAA